MLGKIIKDTRFEVKKIKSKLDKLNTIYKLRGLSPQANYTDRAAAAGRRS